jgi:hypothetical protein
MISAWFRRPRASSRIFGALLSFLLLAGQTALIAHHHPTRAPNGGRVSMSRQDAPDLDANCRLCSLSAQSRAAHVAAQAPAVSGVVAAEPLALAPSVVSCRTSPLLPSSRAPPAA